MELDNEAKKLEFLSRIKFLAPTLPTDYRIGVQHISKTNKGAFKDMTG